MIFLKVISLFLSKIEKSVSFSGDKLFRNAGISTCFNVEMN